MTTTLTPERIEEIREHLQAAIKNGQPDGWREFEEMLLVRIEDHVLRGALEIVSAYDALSRDGMREALVKAAEAYTAARECAPVGDWQGRLDERGWELAEAVRAYHKSLSPDAPRQKVEG